MNKAIAFLVLLVLEGVPQEAPRPHACVCFTPSGKHMVAGVLNLDSKGWIKIWDVETGKETRTIRAHDAPVTALAVTPDGKHVVSASQGGWRVFELETGTEIIEVPVSDVHGLAVTPDGKHIVTVSAVKPLVVWDFETGKEVRTLKGHKARACAITPDGKFLVSAGEGAKVWDLSTGKILKTIVEERKPVWSLALTPDGKQVALGLDQNVVALCEIASGKRVRSFGDVEKVDEVYVGALAITQDGKRLIAGSSLGALIGGPNSNPEIQIKKNRIARVFQLAGGKQEYKISLDGPVERIAVGPDADTYATLCDGKITLRAIATGKEVRTIR